MGERSWGPDPVSPPTIEFTVEEIEAAIARAIEEREFQVVPGLFKLICQRDPDRAATLKAEIDVAMDQANARYHAEQLENGGR